MSDADDVLAWLLARGKITQEQIDGGVYVCRTNDEEDA